MSRVTGTVTYQGKPLETGTLIFEPEQGRSGTAEIKDGQIVNVSTFKANDGVTPGNVRVAVSSVRVTGQREVRGEKNPNETYKVDVTESVIPTKYNTVQTSGLTYTINRGRNEIRIDLQ
ncbi:MAG: hypothetical protein Q4G68_11335 [Planctomycetia bacterium]|nr:hypothetical protein [Planctomycetia bacterium]